MQVDNNILKLERTIRSLLSVAIVSLLFCACCFAESGASIYKAHCAACHGPRGSADTTIGKSMNLRALGSPDVQSESEEELFAIISKGRKKRMPAYDNKLSRDQINELVRHIRSLKQ